MEYELPRKSADGADYLQRTGQTAGVDMRAGGGKRVNGSGGGEAVLVCRAVHQRGRSRWGFASISGRAMRRSVAHSKSAQGRAVWFDPAGIEQAGRRFRRRATFKCRHRQRPQPTAACEARRLRRWHGRAAVCRVGRGSISAGMFGIISRSIGGVRCRHSMSMPRRRVLHGSMGSTKKPALVIEPGVAWRPMGSVLWRRWSVSSRFAASGLKTARHCFTADVHGINPPFEIVSAGGAGGGVRGLMVGSTCGGKGYFAARISGPLPLRLFPVWITGWGPIRLCCRRLFIRHRRLRPRAVGMVCASSANAEICLGVIGLIDKC